MPNTSTGTILEALNDKMDRDGHNTENPTDVVIEYQAPTSDNGGAWYRKYASGWVEQGGIITETSTVAQKSIVFPVAMADANYNLQVTLVTDTNSNNPTYYAVGARTKSATGFTCYAAASFTKDWKVCGMAASQGD